MSSRQRVPRVRHPTSSVRYSTSEGGSQVAVNDALGLIGQLAGRELDVRYVAHRTGDVNDTGADTSLARAKLGFTPAVGFEDGLCAHFEWVTAMAGT